MEQGPTGRRGRPSHAADEIAQLPRFGPGGQGGGIRSNGTSQVLVGGDIAVLVRTGEQGRNIAGKLRERGVQSVEMGIDSVFETLEATELKAPPCAQWRPIRPSTTSHRCCAARWRPICSASPCRISQTPGRRRHLVPLDHAGARLAQYVERTGRRDPRSKAAVREGNELRRPPCSNIPMARAA